jgi:hypothetical protein
MMSPFLGLSCRCGSAIIQVLLSTRYIMSCTHHRSVELVHAFPLFLTWIHDIDLFILERPICSDVLNNSLRSVTQAAWDPGEEGDAAFEKTGCRAKHARRLQQRNRMTGIRRAPTLRLRNMIRCGRLDTEKGKLHGQN